MRTDLFRFVNHNQYSNYNLIFSSNFEAESLRLRQKALYLSAHPSRKQKAFNPFKDKVIPEYKIQKDIDDLDSQKSGKWPPKNHKPKTNFLFDDLDSQEIYMDSSKSKDFSEMTAIINEQIRKDSIKPPGLEKQ